MQPEFLAIAIAAGFLSGIINTLAGSGSVFTLPLLLYLGLPAHIANGTNRVGILAQTFVGGWMLYVKGGLKFKNDIRHILPTVIGSALGAWTATEVGEEYLRYTIGGVMLLLLVVTWFRYGDFIRESDKPLSRLKELGGYPLLFIIGFYGGFIQLGVGIFTLAALVLFLNFTLKHANALKNMMNFFLTLPAFCVFAIKGHIMWEVGAVVAVGQTAGAFVAARYAIKSESAQIWIRRLLVLMMLVTASELFGLLPLLRKLLFS
ncbi:MAG: sulfite exporter TauE/SafE family protein [Bacteroidota bacterium]